MLHADGCTLVPLAESGRFFHRKPRLIFQVGKIYGEYQKLLGLPKEEIDFDAYMLRAAAGAEIWLLIHGLRQDILGGFELSPDPQNPVASLALYRYPGYHEDWEGNLLTLAHLCQRLVAIGASVPATIPWSRMHHLWPKHYVHRSFKVPSEFAKQLVFKDNLARQAA